jgi:hypothetical protein
VRARAGRSTDRRRAILVLCVLAIALVLCAATSDAPLPKAARRDPAAAFELVQRLRAGERADHLIEYDFARSNPQGAVQSIVTEGRRGRLSLSIAGDTLTLRLPDRVLVCERVSSTASCFRKPGDASLPTSQVIAVAVALGAYDVAPGRVADIAGERGHCFDLRVNKGHALSGLGQRSELCLAADGLVLSTDVWSGDARESRTAQVVHRRIGDAELDELLARFKAPNASK